MHFLLQIEQSSFFTWVHSSPSLWGYPAILFLHTLGMSLIVGVNAGIDLRILGFAPEVPLAPLKRLFPIMWSGFGINAATGTVLLLADATKMLANPVFYGKMAFIALALVNLRVLKTHLFGDPLVEKTPLSTHVKILAATSLILWLAAITAGRWMAYFGGT
jgi:hypothetical protein